MAREIIHPPIYLLMSLAAMALLHGCLPVHPLLAPPLSYAGVPLGLGGIGVAAFSAAAFDRASTGIVPFSPATTLVTGGFYRFSRNPMYVGMAVTLLGTALLLGSITALLPVMAFVLVIHARFILPEEAFLESVFGQRYRDYKSRVRRWL